jgi:hypothetical protein
MEKQESKRRFPTFPQPRRLRTITTYWDTDSEGKVRMPRLRIRSRFESEAQRGKRLPTGGDSAGPRNHRQESKLLIMSTLIKAIDHPRLAPLTISDKIMRTNSRYNSVSPSAVGMSSA